MIRRLLGRPSRGAAPAPQPAPRPVADGSALAQADAAHRHMVSLRRQIGRASQGQPVDADRLREDAAAVLVHARHAYGLHTGEQQARDELAAAATPDDLTGGAS